QIPRLALAVERHPAVEPGTPPRKPPGPQLLGKERPVGIIDLGDIEVEKRPAQGEGLPEEPGNRRRPDQEGRQIAPAPASSNEPGIALFRSTLSRCHNHSSRRDQLRERTLRSWRSPRVRRRRRPRPGHDGQTAFPVEYGSTLAECTSQ